MGAGKMHADEVDIDVSLVRRLLAAQFPHHHDRVTERREGLLRIGHDSDLGGPAETAPHTPGQVGRFCSRDDLDPEPRLEGLGSIRQEDDTSPIGLEILENGL